MRWLDKEGRESDGFCDRPLSMLVEEVDVVDTSREDTVADSLFEASVETTVLE